MMASKYPGLVHQPDDGRAAGPLVRALRPLLRAQFGHPTGLLGAIAGRIMAGTKSNTERARWTLSLLDLSADDRVMEVGFGPGIAIELASQLVTNGLVVGIDHSEVMCRQARRRNARSIRDGRVQLHVSSVEELATFEQSFDKIFSINSIHFWPNPVDSIARMRRMLRPSGLLALTIQPRSRNATDETTRVIGQELVAKLELAGFADCRLEIGRLKPVAVACAIGRN